MAPAHSRNLPRDEATNENVLPVELFPSSAATSAAAAAAINANLKEKRQVLGDRTPLKDTNSSLKRPLKVTLSPMPQVQSPLKQVLSTPAPTTHPVLRDITNSAQALKNPPDLFPGTTVKRSRRLQAKTFKESENAAAAAEDKEEKEEKGHEKEKVGDVAKLIKFPEALGEEASTAVDSILPSKLATTVFPASDDEIAAKDIEHPASRIAVDSEEDELLTGPSSIIPELKDLSKNLTLPAEGEFERRCVIDAVEVPFIIIDDNTDSAAIVAKEDEVDCE